MLWSAAVLLIVGYEGIELLSNDIDHNKDLNLDLVPKMDLDAQRIIFHPIHEESEALQRVMKWSPTVQHAMMEPLYSSPLTRPHVDAVEAADGVLRDETLEGQRNTGLLADGQFGLEVGETTDEKQDRQTKEKSAYESVEKMMSKVLQQTEQAVHSVQQFTQNQTDTTTENGVGDLIGIENIGLAIASQIERPEHSAPQSQSQQPMQQAFVSPFANSATSKLPENMFNQLATLTQGTSKNNFADAGMDILRALANVAAYSGATIVPPILRGYLRKEEVIPSKFGTPIVMSHEMPSPRQDIKGYGAQYYEALANSKDMPMWWEHSGAQTPPPWFQGNAPPNRAHLGRAAVNVPAPPFLDSPYRSVILDYWTGKRPRMLPPVPKAWPNHHMMAYPWNGDGAMKCPCPHAPQLMCDCQGIEYDTADIRLLTPEEKSDPLQKIKNKFTVGIKQTLNNFVKTPYPEMAMMSLLI